jgi:hypothetical protein
MLMGNSVALFARDLEIMLTVDIISKMISKCWHVCLLSGFITLIKDKGKILEDTKLSFLLFKGMSYSIG